MRIRQRHPVMGTKMVRISEMEWWLLVSASRPVQLYGIDDPWYGMDFLEKKYTQDLTLDTLIEDGLLRMDNGKLRLYPWIDELVDICRKPQAVLILQAFHGMSRQHVYLDGEHGLLQYQLAPDILELSLIPDMASLMVLFKHELRLNSQKTGKLPEFQIPADVLMETSQLYKIQKSASAIQRLEETDLPENIRQRLGKTLENPVENLSVTVIASEEDNGNQKTDGFGLLEGEDELWLLTRQDEIVNFQPVSAGMIRRAFVDLIQDYFPLIQIQA